MDTNGIIIIVKAIISFTFIQVIFRLNKSFLFLAVVLNLILVGLFGAKFVSLFGFVTNAGNSFYAAVFFTTQLIVEHYGEKQARQSVFLGACSIVFFMLMSQLTILQISQPETQQVDRALYTLFSLSPRVALASLVAYVVSQIINIKLFSVLSKKTQGTMLYLRINVSNIIGQLVDSLLFFSIAFAGTTSLPSLVELAVVGYTIKVCLGVISTPFFYLQKAKSSK